MGILEASPYNYENEQLKEEVCLINRALFEISIENTIVRSLKLPLAETDGNLRNVKLFGAFFDFGKISSDVENVVDPKYYFMEFTKLNSTAFWQDILAKANDNGATISKIPTITNGQTFAQTADNLSFDHSQIYGLSIQLTSMAILRGQKAINDINAGARYKGSSLDESLYKAFREIAAIFPDQATNQKDLVKRLKFVFPYFPKETSIDGILEKNGVYRSHSLELTFSPLYRRFINAYGRVLENEEYQKAMAIRFSPVTREAA